jgi:hypothetical protein
MSEVSEAARMVGGGWVRFGNVRYSSHAESFCNPKNL